MALNWYGMVWYGMHVYFMDYFINQYGQESEPTKLWSLSDFFSSNWRVPKSCRLKLLTVSITEAGIIMPT